MRLFERGKCLLAATQSVENLRERKQVVVPEMELRRRIEHLDIEIVRVLAATFTLCEAGLDQPEVGSQRA